MKNIFITIIACMVSMSVFAQRAVVEDFVSGKTDKATFVEQMKDYFKKYELSEKQQVKLDDLLARKADHYETIKGLKSDEKLFTRKMSGQLEHMRQSLRFIMKGRQYQKYMMDSRVEYADQRRATKAKRK